MTMTESARESGGFGSLIKGLFDIKFERFISRQAISIIYVIGMILIALGTFIFWIFSIVSAMSADQNFMALVMFFLVPAFGLLYLIGLRMMLESQVVRFRQFDTVKEIQAGVTGSDGQPPATGPGYTPPGPPPAPPVG